MYTNSYVHSHSVEIFCSLYYRAHHQTWPRCRSGAFGGSQRDYVGSRSATIRFYAKAETWIYHSLLRSVHELRKLSYRQLNSFAVDEHIVWNKVKLRWFYYFMLTLLSSWPRNGLRSHRKCTIWKSMHVMLNILEIKSHGCTLLEFTKLDRRWGKDFACEVLFCWRVV